MAKRNFKTVYNNIIAIAPEGLVKDLESHVAYWAPEIVWERLSDYVAKHVVRSSHDPQSIAIYAELCNVSMAEIKSMFEKDGL